MIDASEWNSALQGKFIKFETGEETVLVLRNWRLDTKEIGEHGEKLCFIAEVEELDGRNVWTENEDERRVVEMPSKRFQAAIKPIVLKAQESGRERVKVRVIRSGEGAKTTYTVTDLSKSLGASASSSPSTVSQSKTKKRSKNSEELASKEETSESESEDPRVVEAAKLAEPNNKDKEKVAVARKKLGEIVNLYRMGAVSVTGLGQILEVQKSIIEG